MKQEFRPRSQSWQRPRQICSSIVLLLTVYTMYLAFFTSWSYRGVFVFFVYIPLTSLLLLIPWILARN